MEGAKKKDYFETTENIKFPSFIDDSFNEAINKPLTEEIFSSEFDILNEKITKFLNAYLETLLHNKNEINTNAERFKKKSVKYFFFAKYLSRIIAVLKSKFGLIQLNDKIISGNLTIDDVISELTTNEAVKSLSELQYKDSSIIKEVKHLFEYESDMIKSSIIPGKIIVNISIKYAIKVFDEIFTKLEAFNSIKDFNDKTNKKNNEIIFFDLILILEKIEPLCLILRNASFIDGNDIFNLPEDSDEWKNIKKNMVRVAPSEKNIIKEEIAKVAMGMSVMNSIVTESFVSNSNMKNIFSSAIQGIKYKMNPDQMKYDAKKNAMEDNRSRTIIIMCNLMKNNIFKKLSLRRYPNINFRKKLYLKKEYKEINTVFIKEILENLKEGKLTPVEGKGASEDELNMLYNTDNKRPQDLYLESIQKKYKKYYVSTRLIHSCKITFPNERLGFFTRAPANPKNNTKDTLFIHIHGGGFIGTTTITHEKYLRNWVNHLQIPMIGIDYSLSPQHQYPKALDDIWQAYNWIVDHAEKEFAINPKKIIVSGDSAGGNLVLSIVFLLIVTGKRIPDLVLAEYPCSDTSLYNMSPSMLACMEDFLLNINFLKFCNEAYRSNYPIEEDPFLNPERCPDVILEKMPKTIFYLGGCDPLRDGTIRLIHKLTKLKKDFFTYEFKDYVHGFYGLDSETLRKTPTLFLYKEIEKFLKENESSLI